MDMDNKVEDAQKSLISDRDKQSQIRTARQLMIIPSAIMTVAGLLFVYIASFKNYSNNEEGMWQTWKDAFIIVPVFLLSVLIAIVCLITGLIMLHQARSSHSKF